MWCVSDSSLTRVCAVCIQGALQCLILETDGDHLISHRRSTNHHLGKIKNMLTAICTRRIFRNKVGFFYLSYHIHTHVGICRSPYCGKGGVLIKHTRDLSGCKTVGSARCIFISPATKFISLFGQSKPVADLNLHTRLRRNGRNRLFRSTSIQIISDCAVGTVQHNLRQLNLQVCHWDIVKNACMQSAARIGMRHIYGLECKHCLLCVYIGIEFHRQRKADSGLTACCSHTDRHGVGIIGCCNGV